MPTRWAKQPVVLYGVTDEGVETLVVVNQDGRPEVSIDGIGSSTDEAKGNSTEDASVISAIKGINENLALVRERVTNANVVITSDHAAIHAGEGFSVYITADNLANGASRNVALTMPDTGYVHLKFYDAWISNSQGLLELYEDPHTVSGGASLIPVNRRRLGTPRISGVTVLDGATVTLNEGDHNAQRLEVLRFGGGGTGPQGRAGGDRSTDIEWVLKPSTSYVLRVTNNSSVAADIGVWIFWYEEEDG